MYRPRGLLTSDEEFGAMVLDVLLVCSGFNRLRALRETLERLGIGRNGVGNELKNCKQSTMTTQNRRTFVFTTQEVTLTLPTSSHNWW
jgi:hypothetical protein